MLPRAKRQQRKGSNVDDRASSSNVAAAASPDPAVVNGRGRGLGPPAPVRIATRTAPAFRQHDVTRALRGVASAGMQASRLEIDQTGKIVIQLSGGERVEPSNALDKWMAEHADQA
jgi:hypothetical protein